ncbi:DUF4105 domain-containing protein [Lutibacter sp. A80]|uniref:lipoprotein N-acyltransferase Lnb domain-containing protein n=1 Tax=Lutibacter sp. A80 TaxID=2918453 RepID=UPI001F06B721|nr:DUF4105 domain-containing protein [Lutibacter sp. A80]UMB60911.1 DUF4105 domain-containing protein [Lutibacter sp. A80]
MNPKHFFFLIAVLFSINFQGQTNLSEKATISVVTCGPGSELYASFGHSAFRVFDPINKIDKIYNYGTFNFDAPNFYLNFAKGKLTYQLSTTRFGYFLQIYNYEKRWVKTQELNLNKGQTQAIYNFLENNAKPANKDYQYDFFYNNCSTKIEEVIKGILKDSVTFNNNHITTQKTHRDLIADYTKNQKWGKFGIDLALGSVIDKKATKDDYKFLPDYIFSAFEHATINTKNGKQPLVKETKTVLNPKPNQVLKPLSFLTTPLFVLSCVSLLILFLSYKNFKNNTRSKWLDFSLFFITGIVGIAVLLLWFATDHTATYKNLNFLWAFAPNLIVAFYAIKLKLTKWTLYYTLLLISLIALAFILWIYKIQVFNIAMLPLLVALLVHYLFLLNFIHKKIK